MFAQIPAFFDDVFSTLPSKNIGKMENMCR